ncbi:Rrf2 family transcriptional regulator [Mycetohabitans endofungorum]|uniref:Rrf2 family transcriptional regulator n=1 Tax=Mycetohabitans endofungorum TaxID=417203 RepID=UPI002B0614C0|nr:Rrf2 family transcriptional regulator [Mycetohabitans endofungorum]
MRLTDFTDYAFRVILYLSVHDDGLSTIQQISDAYQVSKNHLMKVVQLLGERGWFDMVRGRNGGLRLAPHARTLTVGTDCARHRERFCAGCLLGADVRHACAIEPHCQPKVVMVAALQAFLAELGKHTEAELSQPSAPLAHALGLITLTPGA